MWRVFVVGNEHAATVRGRSPARVSRKFASVSNGLCSDTAPDSMRKTILSRMEELLSQLVESDALNLDLIG